MAQLRGGTTIAGFTALHAGLDVINMAASNVYVKGGLTTGEGLRTDGYLAVFGAEPWLDINATRGIHIGTSATATDNFHIVNNTFSGRGLKIYNGNYGNGTVLMSLGSDGNVAIGKNSTTYKLDVAGHVLVDGWVRTSGNTGWLSHTYGGGWHMSDSNYIRVAGNKSVYINRQLTVIDSITVGNQDKNYSPSTSDLDTNITLNALNYSVIGFHDKNNRVDFMRVGNGAMVLGYNGGWGHAEVHIPGALVVPVGTDKYAKQVVPKG